ncbi:hypothetical protein AAGV33_07870 [Flavobacterium sp. FBOR7N2.3]|uniref:Uncharacterized protein n=1 Tax=Flavobacterium magnesitis TaxID=3138077 RepID=A0ABV4TJN9_9FLAO
MGDKSVRFVRKIIIQPSVDFNQDTKDTLKSILNSMYFNENFDFYINDFSKYFTIENLTSKARIDFIDNDLNIKFISIVLDKSSESSNKLFKLYYENKDKFNFGNIHCIGFSKKLDFVSDDGIDLVVLDNGNQLTYNIQSLINMNTTYQTIQEE